MSFERWGHTFEGAWTDPNQLESRSGVYVIWCETGDNWEVVDVGESHDVKNRVLNHDRKDCWERNCSGAIYYSGTYTPNMEQAERRRIEQAIRARANPPCGEE
jgi:hypothetical protein